MPSETAQEARRAIDAPEGVSAYRHKEEARQRGAYAAARALLGMAYQDGVRLAIGDDGPRASGPEEALRRWLPLLRPHRDAVEAIIEAVEERAAIMEHDGGLSRVDAEAEAVRLVIGGEA